MKKCAYLRLVEIFRSKPIASNWKYFSLTFKVRIEILILVLTSECLLFVRRNGWGEKVADVDRREHYFVIRI